MNDIEPGDLVLIETHYARDVSWYRVTGYRDGQLVARRLRDDITVAFERSDILDRVPAMEARR